MTTHEVSQPWYMNPTAEESLAWIRKKIGVPEDAKMFSGKETIAGQLHVIFDHHQGYMNYITSYKCNDKQGEIARQSVRISELERELKRRCQCRWDEVDGSRIRVSECHLHQCERSVLLDNGDPSKVTKDERIAELMAVLAMLRVETDAEPCDQEWLEAHQFKFDVNDGNCLWREINNAGLYVAVTIDKEGFSKTLILGWDSDHYSPKISMQYLLEDQPTKGQVRKLLEVLGQ